MHHTDRCFTEINGYSKRVLKETFDSRKIKNKNSKFNINNKNNSDTSTNNLSDKIAHTLNLPHKEDHVISLMTSLKSSAKKISPEKHDVRIILTDTILSSQFNNKDDTDKEYNRD